MGQNGQGDADAYPQHKGDKQIGAKIRKRTGEFLILLIYLIIDAFEAWPRTHVGALLAFVAGLIALMLLDGEFSYRSVASAGVSAAVISALVFLVVGPAREAAIVGWLQPANDPTPPNSCDESPVPRVRSAKPVVMIGDNAFVPGNPQNYDALAVGQCAPLNIQRKPNGTAISVDIYSASGHLIGRLRNNGYEMAGDQRLTVERSGDLSALVIHDEKGTELLYVRLINPDAVRIRGTFTCPAPTLKTVVVTDKGITGPRATVFSDSCLSGGRGGIHF